jgi:hypothetical protein
MKQQKISTILLILILAVLAMPPWTCAEEQWHFQSAVAIPGAGFMEAVLPAGLFFSADEAAPTSQVDLSLIGPDGNPRSFELYWKEDTSFQSTVLKSSQIRLDKTHALIWEAASPKDLQIEKIRIDFSPPQTMGKVTIQGRDRKGWHNVAENAALYRAENRAATEIEIKPAVYEELRLSFKGYDREFRETPFQVKAVTVSGKSIAKDYIENVVELSFADKALEGKRTVSALLPGSGLWIRTVVLSTEAQFQGTWELGQEVVQNGKLQFQQLSSGTIATVGKTALTLELPVDRSWPGRSLILKLDPAGTYVGRIAAMKIMVNLPRMTFYADKAGTYVAQTGNGNKAFIKATPGDSDRKINNIVAFSAVSENLHWVPERLAEKYWIAGGPFNEQGYFWSARMKIQDSGYYRLVLNREASLSSTSGNVRLVRDNIQVPYFRGPNEDKEIGLDAATGYDQGKNRSTWTVKLPDRSEHLPEMTGESQGIFDRQVMIEIPKPGRSGWQPWKTLRWQNVADASSILRVGLAGLPNDVTEMRIAMDHGDNRPIDIKKIQVTYQAPTLLFLIPSPGEYILYGGNAEISEAKYDLALVQAHLAAAVPKTAFMGDIEPLRSPGIKLKILSLFDDKSWGLYAVLGLVTVVLMMLIVRLFPKEQNG